MYRAEMLFEVVKDFVADPDRDAERGEGFDVGHCGGLWAVGCGG